MPFDSLIVRRKTGPQHLDERFLQKVHSLTMRSGIEHLPLEETRSRLSRANLGHYVYLSRGGKRELVAYALNEVFDVEIEGGSVTVNYFCSAFLLPETRTIFSLYRLLGAMRLIGGETFLLVRTQSPLVMTSFARLCRQHGYRTFGPLSERVPRSVRDVLRSRFEHDALVHRSVYPGRISPPATPRNPRTARLMALIEPDRGDACVFAAARVRDPAVGAARSATATRDGAAA